MSGEQSKVRNDEIKGRMKVGEDVLTNIEENKLIWYGQVKRAHEGCWIFQVMEWSPFGKIRKG